MKNIKVIFAIGFVVLVGIFFLNFRLEDRTISTQDPLKQGSGPASRIQSLTPTIDESRQNINTEKLPKQKLLLSKLEELAASKLPKDQFASYQILSECVKSEQSLKEMNVRSLTPENEEEKKMLLPETQKMVRECEGITYAQKSRRFDQLEIAMKAGVKGAATAFFNEGPFGDQEALVNRPNDAAVIDWKQRAIKGLEAAAMSGDKEAFSSLYQLYDSGVLVQRDPYKALIYLTAVYEAKNLEQQKSNAIKPASVSNLEKLLGAAEAKDAIGKGNELAKRCCSKN